MTLRVHTQEFEAAHCEVLAELLQNNGQMVGASICVEDPMSFFWSRRLPPVLMAHEFLTGLPKWRSLLLKLSPGEVMTHCDEGHAMTYCIADKRMHLVAHVPELDAWTKLVTEGYRLGRMQSMVSSYFKYELGTLTLTAGRMTLANNEAAERALRDKAQDTELVFSVPQVSVHDLIDRTLLLADRDFGSIGELEKAVDDAEIFGTEASCCIALQWASTHGPVNTSLIPDQLCSS